MMVAILFLQMVILIIVIIRKKIPSILIMLITSSMSPVFNSESSFVLAVMEGLAKSTTTRR